jgi:hypothetical protein
MAPAIPLMRGAGPPSRNLAAASPAPALKIVGAVGTGEATARSS